MTVLSAQSIRKRCATTAFNTGEMIRPFTEKGIQNGMSYGLSQCGYDIRVRLPIPGSESIWLAPGAFILVSSIERIKMPNDLVAIVHDKSSWARKGLAVQNTVLEPGWEGWITLEITNHSNKGLGIYHSDPIAQLLFHQLDEPTDSPYMGKYQNQEDRPVEAIHETSNNHVRENLK